MTASATNWLSAPAIVASKVRGGLFLKYASLFVAVACLALIANGVIEIWFSYREQKALLMRVERERAGALASTIVHFLKGIEDQAVWTTQLPFTEGDLEDRRVEAVRLLRQTPAISELAELDHEGREKLRVSRVARDLVNGGADFSEDPNFLAALREGVHYGPVHFLRQTEPHMTVAVAGDRRDTAVSVAEVNLKFIWDLISQANLGTGGQAYIVDARSLVIAHSDISLVLRNTDFSQLPHVQAALTADSSTRRDLLEGARNAQGVRILAAYAPVVPPGWLLFVEVPIEEALSSAYASIVRSGVLLLAALLFAVIVGLLVARKMVIPIQRLRAGAARIGGGDLSQHVSIRTGDELEALGDQFNVIAAQLRESYATLERKVDERTQALDLANRAKSHLLAAASHDLRQPLHALRLFVAQLRASVDSTKQREIVERIDATVTTTHELFNGLLDLSRLDAGVITCNITEFPVNEVLKRVEITFAGPAREAGLSLRIVSSSAWIRSDVILLERILFNLTCNALRYTQRRGVVVGCRRRGSELRLEVWDTGCGIPPDQRESIFGEFYRVKDSRKDAPSGLGLGLAIVDRLCRLLAHPIDLRSTVGKGSCFAVGVPLVTPATCESLSSRPALTNVFAGKLIVLLDDDAVVLESMSELLRDWGCEVVAFRRVGDALTGITDRRRHIDLVISGYCPADAASGIDAVESLRHAAGTSIPAVLLIAADVSTGRGRHAEASGCFVLHRPVPPMTLRSLLSEMFSDTPTPARER